MLPESMQKLLNACQNVLDACQVCLTPARCADIVRYAETMRQMWRAAGLAGTPHLLDACKTFQVETPPKPDERPLYLFKYHFLLAD